MVNHQDVLGPPHCTLRGARVQEAHRQSLHRGKPRQRAWLCATCHFSSESKHPSTNGSYSHPWRRLFSRALSAPKASLPCFAPSCILQQRFGRTPLRESAARRRGSRLLISSHPAPSDIQAHRVLCRTTGPSLPLWPHSTPPESHLPVASFGTMARLTPSLGIKRLKSGSWKGRARALRRRLCKRFPQQSCMGRGWAVGGCSTSVGEGNVRFRAESSLARGNSQPTHAALPPIAPGGGGRNSSRCHCVPGCGAARAAPSRRSSVTKREAGALGWSSPYTTGLR